MAEITLESVRAAHNRIRQSVHRTPVLTSSRLNELCGASLFFKCENFQKTGSFKARGAVNAVMSLSNEEAARGVATHSSGNHAAALAWAAGRRGVPAYVVMPRTASRIKIASVERYGGRITFCEPTHKAREEAAEQVIRETGAAMVHPYNDTHIIGGQGTAALEFLEDTPGLDLLICPVGGGGLLAGSSIVAKSQNPGVKVFAGEPEGAADASLSFKSGKRMPVDKPASIADGLLALVGDLTFPIIERHVDDIVTVSDTEIAAAMRQLMEVLKIAVEPSASVSYAVTKDPRIRSSGQRVGIILSGGNVDFDHLPWAKSGS
jgi:threonine dehydratase